MKSAEVLTLYHAPCFRHNFTGKQNTYYMNNIFFTMRNVDFQNFVSKDHNQHVTLMLQEATYCRGSHIIDDLVTMIQNFGEQ